MLSNFYTWSLMFMAGMIAYSVIFVFTSRSFRSRTRLHWLYSGICIIMIFYLCTMAITLGVSSLPDQMLLIRIGYIFYILFMILLPHFYAEYTGISIPKSLVVILYCFYAFLLSLVLTQPNDALFKEPSVIEIINAPWGEKLYMLRVANHIFIKIGFVPGILMFGFIAYALIVQFRRDRDRTTLFMIFGMGLLFIFNIMGALTRMGKVELLPLGPFGTTGMIVIMGLTMSYKIRKELERNREHIFHVQRQERSRLSRDLHDGVGQSLQALRLQLKLLERKHKISEFGSLTQELDDAASELREITHALHPAYLNDITLTEALQQCCNRLIRRGVPLVCDLSDSIVVLPHYIKVHLFRIAQEALANTVRHANASQIQISLHQTGQTIKLCISDNGSGFKDHETTTIHTGLQNIRERSALINAVHRITSDSGGTLVTVETPAP